MEQLTLDLDLNDEINNERVYEFSHQNANSDKYRQELENQFIPITETTNRFDRKLVSFQGNKSKTVHSWFKYKEGYSTSLVESLINDFGIKKEEVILDPFSGSGTTSLTAQKLGISSIAIDILEIARETFEVKTQILEYDVEELRTMFSNIDALEIKKINKSFKYLTITEGAFSKSRENDLLFIKEWISSSIYSKRTKKLAKFVLLTILEEISYTRKDGQYLRWDYRSNKVISANEKRKAIGKPPIKTILDKGKLPTVKSAFLSAFKDIIDDISYAQAVSRKNNSRQTFINGSCLFELPKLLSNTVDGVITSPPYCNRYDYTRTYALELNFLGKNNQTIKQLRQGLLSATVENKSKLIELEEYYRSIGKEKHFEETKKIIDNNTVLEEVVTALNSRYINGEVNNKGIIRMVEGYFSELTFIYSEIFRIMKPGSKIAVVNDNVRFAGEVIPVDFMSCDIARSIGFKVKKIYCLKQKKGNSSQQMKKYGRVPLRKSITIWEK